MYYKHINIIPNMEHFVREIIKTKHFLMELPKILENSPFKVSYIVDQIGIPRTTFYNKLRTNTFTVIELEKIVSVIDPQEYQLTLLDQSLERAFDDIKNNRVRNHEDVMRDIRKKLGNN